MLFMREQAEKKELTEISVNNTMLETDSMRQSLDVSDMIQSHSRSMSRSIANNNNNLNNSSSVHVNANRESSLSMISEMSSTWFNDPEWHN